MSAKYMNNINIFVRKELSYLAILLKLFIIILFTLGCAKTKNISAGDTTVVTFTVVESGLSPGNKLTFAGNSDPQFTFSHTNPISSNNAESNVQFTYNAVIGVGSHYTMTLLPVTGPVPQLCWFVIEGLLRGNNTIALSSNNTTLLVKCEKAYSYNGEVSGWPSTAGNVTTVFSPTQSGLSPGLPSTAGNLNGFFSADGAFFPFCSGISSDFLCDNNMLAGKYTGTVTNVPLGFSCTTGSVTISSAGVASAVINPVCQQIPTRVQVALSGLPGSPLITFSDNALLSPPQNSGLLEVHGNTASPEPLNEITTGFGQYVVSYTAPPVGYTCTPFITPDSGLHSVQTLNETSVSTISFNYSDLLGVSHLTINLSCSKIQVNVTVIAQGLGSSPLFVYDSIIGSAGALYALNGVLQRIQSGSGSVTNGYSLSWTAPAGYTCNSYTVQQSGLVSIFSQGAPGSPNTLTFTAVSGGAIATTVLCLQIPVTVTVSVGNSGVNLPAINTVSFKDSNNRNVDLAQGLSNVLEAAQSLRTVYTLTWSAPSGYSCTHDIAATTTTIPASSNIVAVDDPDTGGGTLTVKAFDFQAINLSVTCRQKLLSVSVAVENLSPAWQIVFTDNAASPNTKTMAGTGAAISPFSLLAQNSNLPLPYTVSWQVTPAGGGAATSDITCSPLSSFIGTGSSGTLTSLTISRWPAGNGLILPLRCGQKPVSVTVRVTGLPVSAGPVVFTDSANPQRTASIQGTGAGTTPAPATPNLQNANIFLPIPGYTVTWSPPSGFSCTYNSFGSSIGGAPAPVNILSTAVNNPGGGSLTVNDFSQTAIFLNVSCAFNPATVNVVVTGFPAGAAGQVSFTDNASHSFAVNGGDISPHAFPILNSLPITLYTINWTSPSALYSCYYYSFTLATGFGNFSGPASSNGSGNITGSYSINTFSSAMTLTVACSLQPTTVNVIATGLPAGTLISFGDSVSHNLGDGSAVTITGTGTGQTQSQPQRLQETNLIPTAAAPYTILWANTPGYLCTPTAVSPNSGSVTSLTVTGGSYRFTAFSSIAVAVNFGCVLQVATVRVTLNFPTTGSSAPVFSYSPGSGVTALTQSLCPAIGSSYGSLSCVLTFTVSVVTVLDTGRPAVQGYNCTTMNFSSTTLSSGSTVTGSSSCTISPVTISLSVTFNPAVQFATTTVVSFFLAGIPANTFVLDDVSDAQLISFAGVTPSSTYTLTSVGAPSNWVCPASISSSTLTVECRYKATVTATVNTLSVSAGGPFAFTYGGVSGSASVSSGQSGMIITFPNVPYDTEYLFSTSGGNAQNGCISHITATNPTNSLLPPTTLAITCGALTPLTVQVTGLFSGAPLRLTDGNGGVLNFTGNGNPLSQSFNEVALSGGTYDVEVTVQPFATYNQFCTLSANHVGNLSGSNPIIIATCAPVGVLQQLQVFPPEAFISPIGAQQFNAIATFSLAANVNVTSLVNWSISSSNNRIAISNLGFASANQAVNSPGPATVTASLSQADVTKSAAATIYESIYSTFIANNAAKKFENCAVNTSGAVFSASCLHSEQIPDSPWPTTIDSGLPYLLYASNDQNTLYACPYSVSAGSYGAVAQDATNPCLKIALPVGLLNCPKGMSVISSASFPTTYTVYIMNCSQVTYGGVRGNLVKCTLNPIYPAPGSLPPVTTLTNCQIIATSANNGNGLAVNPSHSYVYFTDCGNASVITACPLSASGGVGTCIVAASGFPGNCPAGIAFTLVAGNPVVFIANAFGHDVVTCKENPNSPGSLLTNCVSSGNIQTGVNRTLGWIAVSTSAVPQYAYISDFDAGALFACRVDTSVSSSPFTTTSQCRTIQNIYTGRGFGISVLP